MKKSHPSVAVVTATHDRLPLLKRLYESLADQSDLQFTWVIVDDASTDGTTRWAEALADRAPFTVKVFRSETNIGKAGSLNIAFDRVSSDLFVIVDSDDRLLPEGVAIVRETATRAADKTNVGAFLFDYVDDTGRVLRQNGWGRPVVQTQPELAARGGSQDGCIVYTSEVASHFRYPKFQGETFVADGLPQAMMAPSLGILLPNEVIGIAQYQPGGLTSQGRALRLRNPNGMMFLAKVNARKAATPSLRLKARLSYHAHRSALASTSMIDPRVSTPPEGTNPVERALGYLIYRRWLRQTSG